MSRTAAAVSFNAPMMSPRADGAAPGLGARLFALVSAPASRPLDACEAYLAQSVDHEDFEQRSRAWEAHVVRMKSLTFPG